MMGGMGAAGGLGRGMVDDHVVENSDTFLRAFLTGHSSNNRNNNDGGNNNNNNNNNNASMDMDDDRYLINFIKGVMAQENAVKSDMIDVLKDQILILRQELNNKQSVIDSLLRHYEKPCPHNNSSSNKLKTDHSNNPFTNPTHPLHFDGDPSEKPSIALYSTSSPIPPPLVTNSNGNHNNGNHSNLLLSSSIASCLSEESLNSLVSRVTLRATKTTKDGGDNYYCFNGTGLPDGVNYHVGNRYDDCGHEYTTNGNEVTNERLNDCPNEYPDECVNNYDNELSNEFINEFTNKAYGMSNGFSSDSNEVPGELSNDVILRHNVNEQQNREQNKSSQSSQRAPIHACVDPCKPLSETLLSLRNSIKSNASSSSTGSSNGFSSINGGSSGDGVSYKNDLSSGDEKRVSSNKTIRVKFNKNGNQVGTNKNGNQVGTNKNGNQVGAKKND